MKDKNREENQSAYMLICMCLGMSIGTAIGVATDNLSIYMPIGMSIGLCIGSLIDAQKRNKAKDAPTLRHTMATVSIANGADVVSVSKKLGHAAPSITLNIYSHANQEAQLRANKTLEEALYKKA